MTNAELAILGLIAETPRHGYEIERTIEERGMREWTEIGFSSIYYVLNKLEKNGLIESSRHPSEKRGPVRRVYRITAEGFAALRAATLEALSEPQTCRPPVLLGVAHLPVASPEEALAALRSYRGKLEERRAHVTARLEAQRPLPDHLEMLFGYSLTMIEAEVKWVEAVVHNLAGG